MPTREKIPCPLCPEKFRSPVALDMHMREEHPEGREAASGILREAYRVRDQQRADEVEARALKRLDQLYERGCPCGRSYEAHMKVRAQIRGRV
jgi:hypothetical protein